MRKQVGWEKNWTVKVLKSIKIGHINLGRGPGYVGAACCTHLRSGGP